MTHVYEFARDNPDLKLKPMTFVDEADEVYPRIRPKLLPFLVEDDGPTPTLYNGGTYFVTGTPEPLQKFPEVCVADQLPLEVPESVNANHRNLAHPDSIVPVPTLQQKRGESNRDFANRVLADFKDHFFEKVVGRNGASYPRRTLVLGDYENYKQVALGRDVAATGGASIVINQAGFTLLYKNEMGTLVSLSEKAKGKELKGREMNEKLVLLSKKHSFLRDRPLFIIGNRKIDRAITYHFAPREPVDGRWEPAFLLTDMICGDMDSLAKAVQAFGRMNGVIGHHPDYCGHLWFWVDSRTREQVLRQVRIISAVESESYALRPMADLYAEADAAVEGEGEVVRRDIRETAVCATLEDVKRALDDAFGERVPISTGACEPRDAAEGYHLSGRLNPHWSKSKYGHSGRLEDQTKAHRLVIARLRPDEGMYPICYTDVARTISITKGSQPYVILPVYPTEDSPKDDVRYIARYEEPLRDQKGRVLLKHDRVTYAGNVYKIHEVDYSEYGEPSKAVLGDGVSTLKDKKGVDCRIQGKELLLTTGSAPLASIAAVAAVASVPMTVRNTLDTGVPISGPSFPARNTLEEGVTASDATSLRTELEGMKRDELKALCKGRGVKGMTNKNRSEMIASLISHA
jgi:hypothetical protein